MLTMRNPGSKIVLWVAAMLVLSGATALAAERHAEEEVRNYDARIELSSALARPPSAVQLEAIGRLRSQNPGLGVEYDPATGATLSLFNQVGYLAQEPAADPLSAALSFVRAHLDALGLVAADLDDFEITDAVFSQVTGAHHIYLRQRHRGIQVYNGQLHVNVNRDGYILSVNNAFVGSLAQVAESSEPAVAATAAVMAAATHLGLGSLEPPRLLGVASDPQLTTRIEHPALSSELIEARLMWLPIGRSEVRLVWNFQLHTPDRQHLYDWTVDATTGDTWTHFDWVADDRYRVYEQPVESPNHTSPLPPADARTVAIDPADPLASPLAWHDTGSQSFTIMRGNNVHAYDDRDANGVPPSSQPSCGSARDCDFPIDLASEPENHIPATLANLFYWSNLIHDVQYHYGFDEAAGNFQVNNFGRGGVGGDDVRAEAQDGSGTCNANFSTPPDGSRPRMQMFICPNVSPSRDSALDNGTVIHEYGHGISIRQVGGPSNSSCLNNRQQGGEGWSDWWDQTYTIEVGDQGTDRRPDGTYFIGQDPDGPGIRPQPYSTDPAINDYTYESIDGLSVPHGVGSVWAQALVEVNWALIDQYGFDPDFFNRAAGAGNHRSMLYVNEGLKNTACSPTFTQARDGIIQAAVDNFGGEDVCLIWQAFANFGLGVDAVSGGSNSTSPTNGFSVPPECDEPPPVGPCIFTEAFSGGAGNFVFVDDPQDPAYTSGSASGGNVSIAVGNVDDATVTGMLGSWDVLCELNSPTEVQITTVASLTQASDYEADETSELRLAVNGSTEVLASFTGDGNGGVAQTTGLQTFTTELALPAGQSRISLGCFNNQKTFNNEETDCVFDSVAVEEVVAPPTSCLFTETFSAGAGGFVFVDDPQDPAYTSGSASGGNVSVVVGNLDDATVTDMLGSWQRQCTLSSPSTVTIEVTASLTQASDYEANELSELRLTLNGQINVLASFIGDGNGGVAQTTGLQTFTTNLTLPAGVNTVSLGCFNNQKTFNNEQTDCVFDAVTITEGGGGCFVDEDFESGAAGWVNDPASTCTTGAYVLGTPTEVVNGGVTTQVGGANSGVGALFTGVNTAAGTDDVDGGNCVLTSPTFSISEASTLSIAHFHGQRDAADDPGDFFNLLVSTDGGSTFTSIASNGDQTSNAVWTAANATIPAGSDVVIRVECSDGAGPGDLVECGIDDLLICSS